MKSYLLSFAFLLSGATALANTKVNQPDYAVFCSPQFHFQGQVTNINVARGDVKALKVSFAYGSMAGVSTTAYVVKKTESANLTYEYYRGAGFSMTVNVQTARANVNAKVNGKMVKLQDLLCQFNELTPHPGVTMGN